MDLAPIRRLLPFLSIAVLIGLAYDGWVFYSRWESGLQTRQVKAEKEAAEARRTLALLQDLKITDFYASPTTIKRGGHANICYATIGAKRVRMEPPVKPLYPAYPYCFEVSPRADTEYRLYADDGAGHRVSKSSTIQVTR